MSKKKKIIISVLALFIITMITAFILHILKNKNVGSKTTSVYSVSAVAQNASDFVEVDEMGGFVVNSMEQKIYAIPSEKIKQIYVKKGDVVKAGDILIEYDTTSQGLQLETKKAEIELAKTNIQVAERELNVLKNTIPVENTIIADQPEILSTDTDAIFEEDNEIENLQITYTKEELSEAITKKEAKIKSLNTIYQLKELEYQIMQNQLSNGKVTANFDGVVNTVLEEEDAIANNKAMIVLSGSSGCAIKSTISELSLGAVSIGDSVEVLCWNTGMRYDGKIADISTVPTDEVISYSVSLYDKLESFYPVTINVEEADNLTPGMEVCITDLNSNDEISDSFYMPMLYVKRDNDNFYVMKEADGILKKAYIETGEIKWGTTIEIKKGLSKSDYVAIPYSKYAIEGAKTKHDSPAVIEY